MNNLTQLLLHGLTYGALLSLLMSTTLLGGAYFRPEIMLRGYLPDIKARYGPMSEQARGHLKLIGMLVDRPGAVWNADRLDYPASTRQRRCAHVLSSLPQHGNHATDQ